MYRIRTFTSTNNSLATALGESEGQLLEWLHDNDRIRLIGISTTCVVDAENRDGRFTYLITAAYSTEV
jgi:hypothetical protein